MKRFSRLLAAAALIVGISAPTGLAVSSPAQASTSGCTNTGVSCGDNVQNFGNGFYVQNGSAVNDGLVLNVKANTTDPAEDFYRTSPAANEYQYEFAPNGVRSGYCVTDPDGSWAGDPGGAHGLVIRPCGAFLRQYWQVGASGNGGNQLINASTGLILTSNGPGNQLSTGGSYTGGSWWAWQGGSSFDLGWYPAESTSFNTSEYSGLGMTPKYVAYFSCVPGSLWAHPLNTSLISDAHAAGVGVFLKMDDRTDGSGCGVPGGLPNVANGSDNSYLKAFGTDIANLGIPITITYDWEMNGSWYDYGNGGSLGVTPSEYIQAWNNVVNQVDSTDNGLVTWAWVPNIANGASDASPYWSSNGVTVQHVGEIGVDAYLCLGQTSGTCSQSYDNNLKSGVDAIKALDPNIPTFLGETGIGGTNRETNLQTLVQQVHADGLQGFLYFNQDAEALDSSEQAALGSAVTSINGG